MPPAPPLVSVIVPCLDVEHWIGPCLEAVRANDYPADRVELIVVDNGSRDRTVEIARRHTPLVHEVPGVTISALRNFGAARARGEILAFLDADCLARPDWLREGVRGVGAAPCVCGYLYDVPDGATWVEEAWFAQRDPGRRETTELGGGNLFVEKAAFERIGGFDETLRTGEDAEFCRRARALLPIVSDDRVRVVHLGNPKTPRQFLRREIWCGLGAFGSLRREGIDRPLAGTLAFLAAAAGGLAGLIAWAAGHGPWLLIGSASLLLGLLAVTVLYRRRFLRSPLHALQLAALYALFYLGRSVSFFYLLTGRPYYHRSRSRGAAR